MVWKGVKISMTTFIFGLVILIVGGFLYGKLCTKVMKPDDRKTPAYTKEDGVDFVPMKTWKNSLINLLNIAGTGPILGPIQGILFWRPKCRIPYSLCPGQLITVLLFSRIS